MTDLANQRRIAAEVLGTGVHRVWMNPEAGKDIAGALTREDVKKLITEGKILKKPIRGVSRARARELAAARAYGHRRGHGSRSGAKGARAPRKEQWIKRIRALRRKLKELREKGTIDPSIYRELYRKAKGGEYRNLAHLIAHLEARKLLRGE
jgi:large subunit ribosomal protein L19e